MSRRPYDPLKTIPSAEVLRERLEHLEEEARRVRIVLATAEQIERQQAESQSAQGGDK